MLQSLSGSPDEFVFKDWRDPSKPATARAIESRVHKILLNAGFKGERLSPHTLRHSSASLVMLMSKGNISLVDSLLGHKQGSAATRVYLHQYQESLAQSVSPLQLVKDQFQINHPASPHQPALLDNPETINDPNNTDIVISDNHNNVIDNTPDPLIAQMLPIPSTDTIIRPVINYENLMLIRRAILSLIQFGQITTDAKDAQSFYNRILRNAKKHEEQSSTSEFTTENNNDVFIIK